MATFISTTLAKRTGATTTVFAPATIQPNGSGLLLASGAIAGLTSFIEIGSRRSATARHTRVSIGIPQLDPVNTTTVRYRPRISLEMYIPDGTLQTDVNDLVGYLNAATASGLANLNSLLVVGEGVY